MTDRERKLAIIVGGLLVFMVIYWGYGKYTSAVKMRTNQIASLEREQLRLDEQVFSGKIAKKQMDHYLTQSLPGNDERARSQYSKWLLDMVQENRLRGANVDPSVSIPVAKLYSKHGFRVTGNADIQSVLNLLHSFYAKDYMHRIRILDLKPKREGGFDVEMTVDAIALNDAPIDAAEPESDSWRVDKDVASYFQPIMNRNLFEPTNRAPSYSGGSSLKAYVGKTTPVPLTFSDPEKHRLRYELINAPADLVTMDKGSGTLRVKSDKKDRFEVLVRVTDNGYPNQSIEKKLVINVIDEPKPDPPPPPAPKFDDATQTVLTGVVQGRDDWTAWMNVRTKGKTLKLQVNDEFEIGSVKGKVTEINSSLVEIEIDGTKFTIRNGGNLGEAAKRAKQD